MHGGWDRVGTQGGQGVNIAVVVVVVVCLSVCLSVCPLRCELVRAPWPDRDKTFGGGRGQCQERLSPEPARSAKVCAKKCGKFEFFGVYHSPSVAGE